jgi:hypothetical protein
VRSIDRAPGRWPGEERVILTVDGITPAAWGLLNRGLCRIVAGAREASVHARRRMAC